MYIFAFQYILRTAAR